MHLDDCNHIYVCVCVHRSTCQIWLPFSLMYLSMSVVSSLYATDGFQEVNNYIWSVCLLWKHKSCLVYNNDTCFVCWALEKNRAPAKKNNHRAMDDIRESIKELKYYKETIFKANKGRRWGEVRLEENSSD